MKAMLRSIVAELLPECSSRTWQKKAIGVGEAFSPSNDSRMQPTFVDYAAHVLPQFPSAVCAMAECCKLPFSLRPGLSPRKCMRTKGFTR